MSGNSIGSIVVVADRCQGALQGDAVVRGQIDPVRIEAQPTCKPEDDSIVVFDKTDNS